jgi:two-component system, NarL family, response regulator DesR
LFQYVAQQRNRFPSLQARTSLGLTSREQQLVRLIALGLTNKEIATELNLAEQTVRNHVHRMLRKVGANHRLAMVEMCRLQGLTV